MSHTAPGWSKCPHQAEGLPVDVAVVCFGVVVKKEVGLVGQPGCLGGRGNVTSGLQTQGKECWAGQPTCSPCLVGWGWREWKTSLMPSGAITTPWMLSFSFLFRVRRAKQFKLVYEMKMFFISHLQSVFIQKLFAIYFCRKALTNHYLVTFL